MTRKLRAVKPKEIEKRLKALFYGKSGVGKTMTAIAFPLPYIIDTEDGLDNDEYVDLIEKNGGVVYKTNGFDDLVDEVKTLMSTQHGYKTLVIDPLTTIFNDLIDQCAETESTDFGRHYALANKKMKQLMRLLVTIDMNVIITSHEKNEYGKDMAVIGSTFDCYKKLDYLFDLVFEVQLRGAERVGLVKKSRCKGFPRGETFPFSYDEIANRYGRHILEKEAVPMSLATSEQLKELTRLIELLNISDGAQQAWLKKAKVETLDEMSEETTQKIIDHLNAKIHGETAA